MAFESKRFIIFVKFLSDKMKKILGKSILDKPTNRNGAHKKYFLYYNIIYYGTVMKWPWKIWYTNMAAVRWDFSSLSRKRLLRAWSFETLIPAAATVHRSLRQSRYRWFHLWSCKDINFFRKNILQPTNPILLLTFFWAKKRHIRWTMTDLQELQEIAHLKNWKIV